MAEIPEMSTHCSSGILRTQGTSLCFGPNWSNFSVILSGPPRFRASFTKAVQQLPGVLLLTAVFSSPNTITRRPEAVCAKQQVIAVVYKRWPVPWLSMAHFPSRAQGGGEDVALAGLLLVSSAHQAAFQPTCLHRSDRESASIWAYSYQIERLSPTWAK